MAEPVGLNDLADTVEILTTRKRASRSKRSPAVSFHAYYLYKRLMLPRQDGGP